MKKNKLGTLIVIVVTYISLYIIYKYCIHFNVLQRSIVTEILLIPAALVFSMTPVLCVNQDNK